jgi:hypothetical protein
MIIQRRLLQFITRTNWILLVVLGLLGFVITPFKFALGIVAGGVIVTVNFHLLWRTLKKALKPPHLAPLGTIIAKYYIRFIVSGIIIFLLIKQQVVNPLGLFIGLSVVVASITLATLLEIKNLLFKEAV